METLSSEKTMENKFIENQIQFLLSVINRKIEIYSLQHIWTDVGYSGMKEQMKLLWVFYQWKQFQSHHTYLLT